MEKSAKYVYLMRAGENHYKVGIASDVMKRLSGIQTGNPIRVELIAAVYVPEAHVTENELHQWLGEHKALGGREWFELSPEKVIELIARMTRLTITADVSKYLEVRRLIARQTLLEKRLDQIIEKAQKEEEAKKAAKAVEKPKRGLLFDEAEDIVRRAGKGSTSLLQRKMRIGYARASRLMDELEKAKVVGAADGARARIVIS